VQAQSVSHKAANSITTREADPGTSATQTQPEREYHATHTSLSHSYCSIGRWHARRAGAGRGLHQRRHCRLAGHAVGHGVLGAAGGCFAGRTIANRSARQKQLEQQNLQNGSQGYAPNGGQPPDSYNSGASQSQGYGTSSQGRGYNPRTIQQGSSYAPGTTQN